MSDKLQKFVSKHKTEFDTEEPSMDLWKKIDERMDGKNSFANSKWVSKLKYFGLSAGVLAVATYFISQNLNNSSSNELAQNGKDSAMNNLGQWVKNKENNSAINVSGSNNSDSEVYKNSSESDNPLTEQAVSNGLSQNNITEAKKDSASYRPSENLSSETTKLKDGGDETPGPSPVNKKKASTNVDSRKGKVTAPAEPEKVNSYNSTIYNASSLCEVLRIYKFPGKVSMNEKGNYQGHRILETMSCSKLENIFGMKAVWLKGTTNKKIAVSIKEGFKNIVLVKADGREITPDAISHYYPGLGVISGYTGKHFEMTFKDKVEVILFFKDAEDGDKIIVDGIINSVVKDRL